HIFLCRDWNQFQSKQSNRKKFVQRRQPVRKLLIEYPLHFVHVLLTDQTVIWIRGRLYIRLIRCTVCTQSGRNEDIGIDQNSHAFLSSFLNSSTSAITSSSEVRPVRS